MIRILFLLSALSFSCGIENGKDGESKVGPQGESGSDGVDGSDGAPGRDGKPAPVPETPTNQLVIAHTHCELSAQTDPTGDGYPKFELLYEVTVFSDQSAMAAFVERQFFRAGSQPNVTSNTRFYVKGEAGYNLAAVESTMWKAELESAAKVKFSYKPGAFVRSVACK